jgi:hypothetical protein
MQKLEFTRRDLRNFVAATAILIALFSAGVTVAFPQNNICAFSKLVH